MRSTLAHNAFPARRLNVQEVLATILALQHMKIEVGPVTHRVLLRVKVRFRGLANC